MNILITGAAGFIGYSLSKYILDLNKNHKIFGVDILNSYYSPKLKKKRFALIIKPQKIKSP